MHETPQATEPMGVGLPEVTKGLLKEQQIHFMGDWRMRSVLLLLENEACQKDVRTISKMIGLTTDEVFEALDFLKDVGFVEETKEGRFIKKVDSIKMLSNEFNVTEKMRNHAMICSELISRLRPKTPSKFNSSFVYCNRKTVSNFINKFETALKEFLENADKDTDCDCLIGFQYSLVDMLKKEERREI